MNTVVSMMVTFMFIVMVIVIIIGSLTNQGGNEWKWFGTFFQSNLPTAARAVLIDQKWDDEEENEEENMDNDDCDDDKDDDHDGDPGDDNDKVMKINWLQGLGAR